MYNSKSSTVISCKDLLLWKTEMSRKRKSIEEKIQILDKVRCYDGRLNSWQLSEMLSLKKSTLTRLCKNESKLRCEAKELPNMRKRIRLGKNNAFKNVENALRSWVEICNKRAVSLNAEILKEKAKIFATELGYPEFIPSHTWFTRFKTRYQIKLRRAPGESSLASHLAKQWKFSTMPQLLKQYSPDDIYNADETGLYYRATPNGSLNFRTDALTGFKSTMDHITVLVCANMSGCDKKKLLVIGKMDKSRNITGLKMESLPVEYTSNENACMTSSIFSEWVTRWNAELVECNRKIVLIVDSCTAHMHLQNLSNIQLEFLPPLTTPLRQPMERGIVRDLKMLYRSSLVEFTMKAIQKSLLKPESTARHVSSKISILHAVSLLADSWCRVKKSTIVNSYRNCGFKLPNESDNVSLGSEGNASFDKEILKVTNFKEFLEVDGKLCCCVDDEDDLVALIVQNIKEQCSTISNTHDRPGPCIASISNADTNEEDFTKEGEEVVISSLPPQMLEEYYVKEEDQDAADNISVKEEPMCLSGNQVLPGSGGERAQPSITDQLPTLSLPCPSVCKEEVKTEAPDVLQHPSYDPLEHPSHDALNHPTHDPLNHASHKHHKHPSHDALPHPSHDALPHPSHDALPHPSHDALPHPSHDVLPHPSHDVLLQSSPDPLNHPSYEHLEHPSHAFPRPSQNITTVVSEDQLQLPPRLEQRLAIKFCIGLGKSAEETLAMIRQVFGSESLPSSAVMRWHKFFRECAQLNSR
ncbi:tigger transposable element-derived protein 4 [Hyalella azteca]|uniref:Tigger transposable element-derived protein 4 n=1 Tax=Hyalella azteca TaxID=294128 RepID=A0A8B7NLC3_HYAAZ|nr:tigger transposable element-derived protein 4 [Hyalella azteca]